MEVLDMKRLAASLLMLMCLASLATARQMGEQKQDTMSKGMMMGMEKGMGSHIMSDSIYQ